MCELYQECDLGALCLMYRLDYPALDLSRCGKPRGSRPRVALAGLPQARQSRSRLARGSLKDPRHIEAALKQRHEELLVLLGERLVMELTRQRADVQVPEPGPEGIEQLATGRHRLVDRPGMGYVEAEARFRELSEPPSELVDAAPVLLTRVHVLRAPASVPGR